jgi:biotin carboxylase
MCFIVVIIAVLHLVSEYQRQITSSAGYCCRELGLHTGVYSVEMVMTSRGVRLIEINACMGGSYLRDWVRRVYGVDLLQSALLCACGILPHPTGPSNLSSLASSMVRDQLMGLMLYPSHHSAALKDMATPQHLQAMHDESEVIVYNQLEEEIAELHESQQFEEPFANLAVKADSVDGAKAKLIALCVSLGLETEDDLKPILKDFIDQ